MSPSSREQEHILQQQESIDQFRNELAMQASPNARDVQSSLNPNAQSYAPEVMARIAANEARGGVIGRPVPRQQQSQETSPRGGPVPFESLPNPHLQMQMRAAILAAGASLQMQTLQAQQQAAQQAQRFQQQQQQQQQAQAAAAAALMSTPDFNPPSAETLRMLQTALQGAAAVAANAGPSPTGFQANSFGQSHPSQQMQPNPIGPISRGRKMSDLNAVMDPSSHAMVGGVTDESKSFPRPIGTERAQRTKNPSGVIGSLTGSPFGFGGTGVTGNDLWMDMNHGAPVSEADWLNAQFSASASDPLVSNLLQSSMTNRAFDGGFADPVMDHNFQFSMDQGYGNSAAGLMPNFLNGGIPSMTGHPGHVGQHSSHPLGGMPAPQMPYLPQQPSADDYWSGKLQPSVGMSNGMEASMDHKNMVSTSQLSDY